MSCWVLEAKAFPKESETRSEAATSATFVLTPGTYTVGRKEGQCDIDVPEDKSISRLHAEIKVPSIEELKGSEKTPCIIITDKSKYGTLVSKDDLLDGEGQVGTVQEVEHRSLIKFGYSSPFRVKKLDWSVILHPRCTQETSDLATELGFAIINDAKDISNFSESRGESMSLLVMPNSEAVIDGLILKTMMVGVPVVPVEWLSKWKERKVWKNECPRHQDYQVQLKIINSDGRSRSLPVDVAAGMAITAVERHSLKILKFVWKPSREGSIERVDRMALQQATVLAGGKLSPWPESKARLPKRDKNSYIVVVESPEERQEIAPYMKNFKWITHDHLILALIDENPLEFLHDPEEEEEEKEEEGKEPAGGARKGNYPYRGTIPDSEDEEAEEMELETAGEKEEEKDGDEEETQAEEKDVKIVQKSKSKQSAETPSRATRLKRKHGEPSLTEEPLITEEERTVEESNGKTFRNKAKNAAAASAAAGPSPTAVSPSPSKRKKTRGATTRTDTLAASQEDSAVILVDSPPSVHPSSSKTLGRKKGSTKATTPADTPIAAAGIEAPAPAPAAAAAAAEDNKIKSKGKTTTKTSASPSKSPAKKGPRKTAHVSMILPVGEGWKARVVVKTKAKPGQGAMTAMTSAGEPGQPVSPTAALAAADGQSFAPSETKTATIPDAAAPTDAAAVAAQLQQIKPAVDASSVFFDNSLLVAPPHHGKGSLSLNGYHGAGGFKAFRRNGSAVQGGTARLPRIPFDPEPYREGSYKNDEFLREEAEKEAATKVADALFDANLKPKRDKKALDEGKRKLLAMLPESARRRLG